MSGCALFDTANQLTVSSCPVAAALAQIYRRDIAARRSRKRRADAPSTDDILRCLARFPCKAAATVFMHPTPPRCPRNLSPKGSVDAPS